MGRLASHPLERIVQLTPQFTASQRPLHMQHNVQRRQLAAMQPERLPSHPLQPIALMRLANGATANNHPQPRPQRRIASGENAQRPAMNADLRRAQHPAELAWAVQAAALGETVSPSYADSRLRPLARRALITLRPALVDMRARNPWVRLRLRLLG